MIKYTVTTILLLILVRLFGFQFYIERVSNNEVYNYVSSPIAQHLKESAKQVASDIRPMLDQENISEDTSNGAKEISSDAYNEIMGNK